MGLGAVPAVTVETGLSLHSGASSQTRQSQLASQLDSRGKCKELRWPQPHFHPILREEPKTLHWCDGVPPIKFGDEPRAHLTDQGWKKCFAERWEAVIRCCPTMTPGDYRWVGGRRGGTILHPELVSWRMKYDVWIQILLSYHLQLSVRWGSKNIWFNKSWINGKVWGNSAPHLETSDESGAKIASRLGGNIFNDLLCGKVNASFENCHLRLYWAWLVQEKKRLPAAGAAAFQSHSNLLRVSILPIFQILAISFAVMWKGSHVRHLIFQKCDMDDVQIYQDDWKKIPLPHCSFITNDFHFQNHSSEFFLVTKWMKQSGFTFWWRCNTGQWSQWPVSEAHLCSWPLPVCGRAGWTS